MQYLCSCLFRYSYACVSELQDVRAHAHKTGVLVYKCTLSRSFTEHKVEVLFCYCVIAYVCACATISDQLG
jgi:hypothetical protein